MQLVDEQSDDSDNNAESSSKSDSGKKSSVEVLCSDLLLHICQLQ